MSYIDKFGGVGEAYVKLYVYEAHKKIADGEISAEDASALSYMGRLEAINAMLSEKSQDNFISTYEKYLIVKAHSKEGLTYEDSQIVIALSRAVFTAVDDETLGVADEIGVYKLEFDSVNKSFFEEAKKQAESMDFQLILHNYHTVYEKKINALGVKAKLISGHADALEKLIPDFEKFDYGENTEAAKAIIGIIKSYCEKLKGYSLLYYKMEDMVQTIKECAQVGERVSELDSDKKVPAKENDAKTLLDKKNPIEVKKAVENNSYSSAEKTELVKILDGCIDKNGVDDFEKLVWLDDGGKYVEKNLAKLKDFYTAKTRRGCCNNKVRTIEADASNPPKIPSRNILPAILIILVSTAVAALVAFHPAVGGFFVKAQTPVLAIITVAAFVVGAFLGGAGGGIGVAFAWIVVSYLLNKLVAISTLLHIVSVILLLLPVLYAIGDISSRGKRAVRNARRQRHSYFERLDERCDDIKSYIDSLSDRLTKICGDSEERKAALNYYGDLKNAVSMTEQKIDSQL